MILGLTRTTTNSFAGSVKAVVSIHVITITDAGNQVRQGFFSYLTVHHIQYRLKNTHDEIKLTDADDEADDDDQLVTGI